LKNLHIIVPNTINILYAIFKTIKLVYLEVINYQDFAKIFRYKSSILHYLLVLITISQPKLDNFVLALSTVRVHIIKRYNNKTKLNFNEYQISNFYLLPFGNQCCKQL